MKLSKICEKVIEPIVRGGIIKATKFIDEKFVIRATRKCFNKKICKGDIEIILKIGKPNFEERIFIKNAKKAGEPFPIKKIQLKWAKPN